MSSSLDLAVLRAIKRREQFNKVDKFIPESALDKHTKLLVEDFRKYYRLHPNDSIIDMDIFRSLFFNKWHKNLTVDVKGTYDLLIERVCDDITEEQQASIINSLLEMELAIKVANDIAAYDEGDEFDLIERVRSRTEATRNMQEIVMTSDYATLDDLTQQDGRTSSVSYQWPLPCLANSCRPVEGGDFIVVAARPDTGKTSLTLQLVASWIQQTSAPVIWLNNESSKLRILKRLYSVFFQIPASEVTNLIRTGQLKAALKQYTGREEPIRIYDVHNYSSDQVESLIRRTKEKDGLGGVVWDMLDNIKFKGSSDATRTDQVLEEKYQWARELGVELDFPNVGTSQASWDAEGEKWPLLHMLKDSKTGKQGACDMLIYMGRETDTNKDSFRYLSAPKNKLALEGSKPIKREVRFSRDTGVTYEE